LSAQRARRTPGDCGKQDALSRNNDFLSEVLFHRFISSVLVFVADATLKESYCGAVHVASTK
jgi:hypothetical protein